MNRTVYTLTIIIAVLALLAAGTGLFWQGEGEPVTVTTPRGQTAELHGRGIYQYDTVSGAAQEKGNDAVVLFIGLPLLLTGLVLSRRGSLRGHLLLTGSLAYFLYTYASMAFLTAFNALFLVYVALFSCSLFAFILALNALDPAVVAAHITERFPRRVIVWYMAIIAGFLSLAWLGLVFGAITSGEMPAGTEINTTLVIQVLDLGIIVPTAIITAVLLRRQQPWGYTLSVILMLKVMTMGAALIAMIIGQMLAGFPLEPVTTTIFGLICVSGIILSIWTFTAISEDRAEAAGQARPSAA